MRNKGCNIDECINAFYAKGLCRSHYHKQPYFRSKQRGYELVLKKKRLAHKALYFGLLRNKYNKQIAGVA